MPDPTDVNLHGWSGPPLPEPGVIAREKDRPGNASRGHVPPEHPIRSNKGDLGSTVIPGADPRPLSHSGKPFVLKP